MIEATGIGGSGLKVRLQHLFVRLGVLPFLLVIAVIVFASLSGNFLTGQNLLNVARQATYLAIVAMGQMLALLTGGFDLSVGKNVAITSVVGVTGNPGQGNYTASKAGLIGMIKTLGAEYAKRNVTANCIAPGFIATPMTDALNDKQRETILSKVPAARLGAPEDIAAAAVYLSSNEAAYVTGQTIHVNGGMAMI